MSHDFEIANKQFFDFFQKKIIFTMYFRFHEVISKNY